MANFSILKHRSDFLFAASSGFRWVRPLFVIQLAKPSHDSNARVGYTVTKKQGNAVERNRIKRRLREVVRCELAPHLRKGFDYVFIGRRSVLEVPFTELTLELSEAIARLHRVYDKKNSE